MFTVTVVETLVETNVEPEVVQRYEQTVDAIDLRAIISAVNQKPRKPREQRAPKTK
jgi:hypothetical protein